MKLRGLLIAGMMGLMATPSMAAFMEAQMGYLNYGVRGGRQLGPVEVSVGYLNVTNERSALTSNVDIHALDLSVGKRFGLGYGVSASVSGGVGYGIPNVHYGSDKADNGMAWVLGGGLAYDVTPDISVGLNLKHLIFTTDVQRTIYGFHRERVNGLGIVEFQDIYHSNHRVNLDTVTLGLAVKFRF